MPNTYRGTHFSLKSLAIAKLSQACQGITYTSRHGLTAGLKRKGGLGFLPLSQQLTAEEKFLASLDLRNKVVYDIGGYQGLLTIFFAKSAKQVITYKANPLNVSRINENARLNGQKNVLIRNAAVGASNGVLRLKCDPLLLGGASGDPDLQSQMGDSPQIEEWSVVQTTLDNDITNYGLADPDFIKIDIEGMELAALQGMQDVLRRRPALYIELHGASIEHKRNNARRVLECLASSAYEIRDVEENRQVEIESLTGREAHLYCLGSNVV